MSQKKEILNQLNNLTIKLIETNFSIKQNFPSNVGNEIVWSGYKDIAFTLKNESYDVIYKQCLKEKAYNFLLLDNALIQIMYRFSKDGIISHRLSYYPHPNFINIQDDPEFFEELAYGYELFTDIIDRKVITIPIRFDYDMDEKKFIEMDHSYSHLTLGNYKNCRIPVASPVSPNKFIEFILRTFYFERYSLLFNMEDLECSLNFPECLTEKEKAITYIAP